MVHQGGRGKACAPITNFIQQAKWQRQRIDMRNEPGVDQCRAKSLERFGLAYARTIVGSA